MRGIGKLLKAGLLSLAVAASNISVMAIEAAPVVPENVKAKYIFFFIGDGMGAAQKQLAELYLQDQEANKDVKLTMSEFDEVGLATTWCENYIVTDSAAAGTALSTGHKTNMGMIGVTPDGKPAETLVEKAESLGLATGLVTTTRITHATPASFAAHLVSREDDNEIALDYMDSGVEYFAGGGARHFVGPDYKGSDVTGKPIVTKRTDQKDLVKELQRQGYKTFVGEEGMKQFDTYTPKDKDKIFATFASSHMPYTVEANNLYKDRNIPTLAEMVRKGIDVLDDYDKGFFMMVEGGRIDQAAHAHDGASTIQETLAFNNAIKEAYNFYRGHPEETLILVTGDHETGGLSIAANTSYEVDFKPLDGVKVSVEDTLQGAYTGDRAAYFEYIANNLGLTDLTADEKAMIIRGMEICDEEGSFATYGQYNPVAMETIHVINNRAKVGFNTYTHSGTSVPVYTMGVGAEYFGGNLDNTDIPKIMTAIMD